ncbi:MAG: DUF4405 domain-containing protein [Pseudomonadota bacterium]
MSKSFNSRAFISLSIFLSFSVLLVTSILMFIDRHTLLVAMLHTFIGMTLLLVAFWHIKNNLGALLQYFKWRVRARGFEHKFNMAMPLALFATTLVVVLSIIKFSPFLALYEWGNMLRAGDKAEKEIQFTYIRVDKTSANAHGARLTIDLRKGPYFMWPQYAIWLETLDGEFIQPLYVTQKLARNAFSNKVTKRDPSQIFTSNPFDSSNGEDFFTNDLEPQTSDQRMRPESLPVFLHKLGIQTAAGVFVPTGKDSVIDAYSGATMLDHFLFSSQTEKPLPDSYKVRFEINASFDFNKFYSSDRYPDDPIYSGNGYSAQPSIVYEAIVDTASGQRYFPMAVVGRGHHSGQDGELYKDLENLTTAREMVDRIIVEIH